MTQIPVEEKSHVHWEKEKESNTRPSRNGGSVFSWAGGSKCGWTIKSVFFLGVPPKLGCFKSIYLESWDFLNKEITYSYGA